MDKIRSLRTSFTLTKSNPHVDFDQCIVFCPLQLVLHWWIDVTKENCVCPLESYVES